MTAKNLSSTTGIIKKCLLPQQTKRFYTKIGRFSTLLNLNLKVIPFVYLLISVSSYLESRDNSRCSLHNKNFFVGIPLYILFFKKLVETLQNQHYFLNESEKIFNKLFGADKFYKEIVF